MDPADNITYSGSNKGSKKNSKQHTQKKLVDSCNSSEENDEDNINIKRRKIPKDKESNNVNIPLKELSEKRGQHQIGGNSPSRMMDKGETSPSRIMEKEEEEELERLRIERMTTGRRRGAFYAANTSSSGVVIGLDPNEEIPEAPSSNSGLVTLQTINTVGDIERSLKIKSRSKRVHCGYAETVGRRPSMEDDFVFVGNFIKNYDFFGVFDGHRGSNASSYASQEILSVLLDVFKTFKNESIEDILKETFIELNRKMKKDSIPGGTTSIIGLIAKNTCYIAHVGDSRAVLCRNNKAIKITEDHKPDRIDELQRITELGGEITNIVTKDGKVISRVQGLLSVSRALGDFDLAPYIIPEPEINEIDLSVENTEYLILACDGLWDVISEQESIEIASPLIRNYNTEVASKRLRDVAYARGSTDNITVLVIKFLTNDEIESELSNMSECICTLL